MKLDVTVREQPQLKRKLRGLGKTGDRALVTGINRATRDLKPRIAKITSERINLSRREISQYIVLGKATINRIQSINRLQVQRIPIERFKPRVEMRMFTLTSKAGRQYQRKLPTIHVQRERGGPKEYVQPAFPLRQRRSGKFRSTDKIRRRIGPERDKLTRVSFFSFPRAFVQNVILPDVDAFVPPRVARETERALQRAAARRGF